jgi:hypothetical protein
MTMWMHLRTAAARLNGLIGRRRLDDDFDAEVRSHVEMLAEDNVRRGLPP